MRLVVLRLVAVCAAVSWLVFPGFGLIDLLVTWSPAWYQVLEAGWGLFSTVLVAAAFVAVAVRPRRCVAALVQLAVATVALLVAALAGGEPPALLLLALLAGETAVVTALALPGREPVRPFRVSASIPLLALALAGAGPWIGYTLAGLRTSRTAAPLDVTVGVDHATVQAALALALAALPVLAALWPHGRRQLGVCSGLAAGYLGLVSLAWPGTPAGFAPWWSALALAWGAAVAVLSAGGRRIRVVAPERSG